MSWTKKQLIEAAFEEIGLANYIFDLEPEQLQSACRRMDAMMSSWEALGIHVGYVSSDTPSSADINAQSGVPSYANSAIFLNLALAIAPMIGKNVSNETTLGAKKAYLTMLSKSMASPMEYQMPATLPRGAGQKQYNSRPFVNPPQNRLETGPDGELELIN